MSENAEPLIAVVTGAGRGIGRAIAKRLATDGYRLELCNLDAAELESTRRVLPPGAVVGAEAFDLTDPGAHETWMKGLLDRHASLDVLVANAGIGGPDAATEAEALAHLRRVLAVNVTAVMRTVRRFAPALRRDGRGRVVVVASVLGKMGVPGFSAYCASKASVIGFVRAVALELARKRITINAVCPGWTDTAMAQQGFEAIAAATGTTVEVARAQVEAGLPLGRIVRPEEIAGLVAFLAGPDCGAMSGQAITMSAGDLQK
ncbi:MAG: SDR family oxidoreductase [Planctomycetes bacterium]|nr:SDR family oxidoreductase [Planctomycetota bacterium]